jgi:hypothetical protein
MIGAGTVINPIIKIITTVAILGAAYLFIVKPTLDTTNNAIDFSFDAFTPAIENAQNVGPQIERSIKQAQKLQDASAQTSNQQLQQARKLLGCINGASGDVDKIQRCNTEFSP